MNYCRAGGWLLLSAGLGLLASSCDGSKDISQRPGACDVADECEQSGYDRVDIGTSINGRSGTCLPPPPGAPAPPPQEPPPPDLPPDSIGGSASVP